VARIRTVKPELFRHEELYLLEQETKLPLRIAFVGLFTVADREGRFEWKPKNLKLDILPFDEIDFSHVLDALASRKFVVKYAPFEVEGSPYKDYFGKILGVIPSFNRHQVINNKESASKLPAPDSNCEFIEVSDTSPARSSREIIAMLTPLIPTQGEKEGKGREKERELEGRLTNAHASITPEEPSLGSLIWDSYSQEFHKRYGVNPVRNAKSNSQCKQLGTRLGKDAIEVVRFYLTHNDGWYLKRQHDLGSLVQAAESLHTQWQRGQAVTGAQVRSFEKQSNNMDLMGKLERGEV
jgi:hypothetical protein